METLKTLKTNLLGVIALVVAFGLVLGMSAFTSAENGKRDTYTFYYDGPYPATVADVEQEDNWTHDAGQQECGGELQMACSITIDESYVDDSNPSQPKLESSAALQASPFGTNAAYVTGSADGTATIVNRLE
ncbi:hypothetical protein [Pedobacter sp.]